MPDSGSDAVVALESYVRQRADDLTVPAERECLVCFLARMCEEFGCDSTLRWVRRFRDKRAPAATALEQRLAQVGGYCDCEVLLNGWTLSEDLCVRASPYAEPEWPRDLPACRGVRRGSTQPCANWVRHRW